MSIKPPTDEVGGLPTGISSPPSTENSSKVINDQEMKNSNSKYPNPPSSTSPYRETSTSPTSNYQDSETTYYELCPHEVRFSENDEQIVIQNLCNRRHEKMSKPCQNGFCYCFTSDSDEFRLSQNQKINQKSRQKPKKSAGTNSVKSDNSKTRDRMTSLVARAQNICPPNPISVTGTSTSGKCEQASSKITSSKHHRPTKRIQPPTVKSRLCESFDADPSAPLIRIVQEIHKNTVVSEVRINRDKIKCNYWRPNEMIGTIQMNRKEIIPTSGTSEQSSTAPKHANKKTQTDPEPRSSNSNGGRLLLKRIGSDAALKLKSSQDPPRKPPRRRFSNSSQSTKKTESPTVPEKAISRASINSSKSNSKSPQKEKPSSPEYSEKCKKSPDLKLRETLPLEKEVVTEDLITSEPTRNYQQTSPSCPILSELSSGDISAECPLPFEFMNSNEKLNTEFNSNGNPVAAVELVPPEVIQMLHYESYQNGKHFQQPQFHPQPQQMGWVAPESLKMGWTAPPKVAIDTVDNVQSQPEDELNNFSSNMKNKCTPIKAQLLSQRSVNKKSFLKDKLLNRTSNANLKQSMKSLGSESSVIPLSKKEMKSTFRKKASQNTKNFFQNSKKKFVRFVFGKDTESFQKLARTIATQTLESELLNSRIPEIAEEAKEVESEPSKQFSHQNFPTSFPKKSIYPKITNAIKASNDQPSQPVNFDFNRKVDSPIETRISQRKLTFPPRKTFKCFGTRPSDKQFQDQSYKSYDSEFNGDFRLAAMSNILASIRSKLETNEGANETTNQEISTDKAASDDCGNTTQLSAKADVHTEPIYSEIKDQMNLTSVQNQKKETHIIVSDLNAIYAEVHKFPKSGTDENHQHLNKILEKESPPKGPYFGNSDLSNNNQIFLDNFFDVKKDRISAQQKSTSQYYQCHDNEHTNEKESDIYTLPSSSNNDLLEQIDNVDAINDQGNESDNPKNAEELDESHEYTSIHDISIEQYQKSTVEEYSIVAINFSWSLNSELSFIFELLLLILLCLYNTEYLLNAFKIKNQTVSEKSFRCYSAPLPQSKTGDPQNNGFKIIGDRHSSFTLTDFELKQDYPVPSIAINKSNAYKNCKNNLKISFRRSKKFIANETKRLSHIFNRKSDSSDTQSEKLWNQSDLGLSQLYAVEVLNEAIDQPLITDQIGKAVSICRQMPEFESSSELVEAERLLLFSSLKRELSQLIRQNTPLPPVPSMPSAYKSRIQIDQFEIPVHSNINHDMFFNYFYIGVFVNGKIIKSTQSVEKHNNRVLFSNCNIYFDDLEPNFGIRAYIYVLRLRKLCNLNISPTKRPSRQKINYSSSDSCDEIVSRFRLQGSFVLIAPNFAPYAIDENHMPRDNDRFYLHARSTCIVPLTTMSRNTNLLRDVKITANIELTFPKFVLKGFLNVEDYHKRHHWNQKWCQLETFNLCFWDYPQDCLNKKPLLKVNLAHCISFPIEAANREICARPKSFSLQIATSNFDTESDEGATCIHPPPVEEKTTETIFLSTDTQNDLTYWIHELNKIVEFVRVWMS